jgi:hypothetical protein
LAKQYLHFTMPKQAVINGHKRMVLSLSFIERRQH